MTRSVSGLTQFKLLTKRMFLMYMRIPIAWISLIVMGFFVGLNQAMLYKGVGAAQFDPLDRKHNLSISQNFLGLSFLVGSDQFISLSFAQVLSVPL